MRSFFRSFYAKLSFIFLLLILALGAGSLFIAFSAARHLFDEVEQLLNREYAASIADELQPLVREGFSENAIKDAIHYMMVLNPMVEIYLLDSTGNIRAYFTHPEESLQRLSIDTAPLEKFIESGGREPVLGDDPRTSSRKKPFSAAPLEMGEETGYVYVILRGESYDRSLEMLRSSYYIRTGLSTFLFALMATLVAGLVLFFLFTRRLRQLASAVRAFEQGKFDYRVDIKGDDELGALGRAFNEMAASVESAVEKLRLAEQQRSTLLTNISHDLRSPLTSIRGHLETLLLKGSKLSEGEKESFLNVSLRNISSLQRLVEDLFELSKLETNQVQPETEPFYIAELVQDITLKFKPKAEAKGIGLKTEQPPGLPAITGDIGMIERVLSNIIENALSYTESGDSVTVELKRLDNEILISVSDTGPGIPGEDLPHIFERFYRGDKSRDRSSPGSGLGLAIAKEIIELHGGTVAAENRPEGGAVFHIRLPF